MLTESMKKSVCLRLNEKLVKYTFSGYYYWDKKSKRCVPARQCRRWNLYGAYYFGQTFQVVLATFLYKYKDLNIEIPEENATHSTKSSEESTNILLLLGTTAWIFITLMLALGLVVHSHRLDMIESTNQIFGIDEKLNRHFPHARFQDSKMTEALMKCITHFTTIVSVVLLIAFFHPAYPLRSLFETMFEQPATITTPLGWTLIIFQTWGAISFCGEAVCLLNIGVLSMHQCKQWQEAATTTGPVKFTNGEMYFDTIGLGRQTGDQLIFVHRSCQLLMDLANLTYASVKVAYHAAAVIVILVLCQFILIRHGRYLVNDENMAGFGVVALALVAIFGIVLLMYSECCLVDGNDTACMDFKNGMLAVTPRKSRMYKVVRSIRPYALKTTYPYLQVNEGTFLKWCDVAVNNLVNLLVL